MGTATPPCFEKLRSFCLQTCKKRSFLSSDYPIYQKKKVKPLLLFSDSNFGLPLSSLRLRATAVIERKVFFNC